MRGSERYNEVVLGLGWKQFTTMLIKILMYISASGIPSISLIRIDIGPITQQVGT